MNIYIYIKTISNPTNLRNKLTHELIEITNFYVNVQETFACHISAFYYLEFPRQH